MNPFAGQLWKFATGAAAVLAIGLSISLFLAHLENKRLSKQLEVADFTLNDPKVGLHARLAQSETNVITVRTALTRQNEVLVKRSKADAARLRVLAATLAETQKKNRENLRKLGQILALPPKGDTLEDRYQDIDRRLMESIQ